MKRRLLLVVAMGLVAAMSVGATPASASESASATESVRYHHCDIDDYDFEQTYSEITEGSIPLYTITYVTKVGDYLVCEITYTAWDGVNWTCVTAIQTVHTVERLLGRPESQASCTSPG